MEPGDPQARSRWSLSFLHFQGFAPPDLCVAETRVLNAACAERSGAVGAQSHKQRGNPGCVTYFGAVTWGTAEG